MRYNIFSHEFAWNTICMNFTFAKKKSRSLLFKPQPAWVSLSLFESVKLTNLYCIEYVNTKTIEDYIPLLNKKKSTWFLKSFCFIVHHSKHFYIHYIYVNNNKLWSSKHNVNRLSNILQILVYNIYIAHSTCYPFFLKWHFSSFYLSLQIMTESWNFEVGM